MFELCEAVLTVTGYTVELAWADQGYTGEHLRQDAQAHGIELQVIKLAKTKKGVVLLPKRWVVGRGFAWTTRFCRLANDCERLPDVLCRLHFLVFPILMLPKAISLLADSHTKFTTRSRLHFFDAQRRGGKGSHELELSISIKAVGLQTLGFAGRLYVNCAQLMLAMPRWNGRPGSLCDPAYSNWEPLSGAQGLLLVHGALPS